MSSYPQISVDDFFYIPNAPIPVVCKTLTSDVTKIDCYLRRNEYSKTPRLTENTSQNPDKKGKEHFPYTTNERICDPWRLTSKQGEQRKTEV